MCLENTQQRTCHRFLSASHILKGRSAKGRQCPAIKGIANSRRPAWHTLFHSILVHFIWRLSWWRHHVVSSVGDHKRKNTDKPIKTTVYFSSSYLQYCSSLVESAITVDANCDAMEPESGEHDHFTIDNGDRSTVLVPKVGVLHTLLSYWYDTSPTELLQTTAESVTHGRLALASRTEFTWFWAGGSTPFIGPRSSEPAESAQKPPNDICASSGLAELNAQKNTRSLREQRSVERSHSTRYRDWSRMISQTATRNLQ